MAKVTIPLTITVDDADLQKELTAISEALKENGFPICLADDGRWRRLAKAWLNFIDDCESIQYGVLSEIRLEHGIPVWGVVVSEDGQARRRLKWS